MTKGGYEVAVAFEFFSDCSSPWTYLACGRVQKLANRTVANLVLGPSLRRGVFNKVNANVDENRKLPRPTRPRSAINWLVAFRVDHRIGPTLWCKARLNSDGSACVHDGRPCDEQGFACVGTASHPSRRNGDVMNCHKESTALGDQKPSLAKARVEDMKPDRTSVQIFASKACSRTHADFVAPPTTSGHWSCDGAQGVKPSVEAGPRLVFFETRFCTHCSGPVWKMVDAPDDPAEVPTWQIDTPKMEETSWA
jgi:hypothetical protein